MLGELSILSLTGAKPVAASALTADRPKKLEKRPSAPHAVCILAGRSEKKQEPHTMAKTEHFPVSKQTAVSRRVTAVTSRGQGPRNNSTQHDLVEELDEQQQKRIDGG